MKNIKSLLTIKKVAAIEDIKPNEVCFLDNKLCFKNMENNIIYLKYDSMFEKFGIIYGIRIPVENNQSVSSLTDDKLERVLIIRTFIDESNYNDNELYGDRTGLTFCYNSDSNTFEGTLNKYFPFNKFKEENEINSDQFGKCVTIPLFFKNKNVLKNIDNKYYLYYLISEFCFDDFYPCESHLTQEKDYCKNIYISADWKEYKPNMSGTVNQTIIRDSEQPLDAIDIVSRYNECYFLNKNIWFGCLYYLYMIKMASFKPFESLYSTYNSVFCSTDDNTDNFLYNKDQMVNLSNSHNCDYIQFPSAFYNKLKDVKQLTALICINKDKYYTNNTTPYYNQVTKKLSDYLSDDTTFYEAVFKKDEENSTNQSIRFIYDKHQIYFDGLKDTYAWESSDLFKIKDENDLILNNIKIVLSISLNDDATDSDYTAINNDFSLSPYLKVLVEQRKISLIKQDDVPISDYSFEYNYTSEPDYFIKTGLLLVVTRLSDNTIIGFVSIRLTNENFKLDYLENYTVPTDDNNNNILISPDMLLFQPEINMIKQNPSYEQSTRNTYFSPEKMNIDGFNNILPLSFSVTNKLFSYTYNNSLGYYYSGDVKPYIKTQEEIKNYLKKSNHYSTPVFSSTNSNINYGYTLKDQNIVELFWNKEDSEICMTYKFCDFISLNSLYQYVSPGKYTNIMCTTPEINRWECLNYNNIYPSSSSTIKGVVGNIGGNTIIENNFNWKTKTINAKDKNDNDVECYFLINNLIINTDEDKYDVIDFIGSSSLYIYLTESAGDLAHIKGFVLANEDNTDYSIELEIESGDVVLENKTLIVYKDSEEIGSVSLILKDATTYQNFSDSVLPLTIEEDTSTELNSVQEEYFEFIGINNLTTNQDIVFGWNKIEFAKKDIIGHSDTLLSRCVFYSKD